MNPQIYQDLRALLPEILVTATLLAIILVDISLPKLRRNLSFLIAGVGLLAALAAAISQFGTPARTLFYGMVALDDMALFFKGFLILTSFLVLLATPASRELAKAHLGEFYVLLMGVTLGMMLLASSVDLIMLFLSLELVSLSSYIMVGYLSTDRLSNEASVKYLLFGAVSTGSMLYGLTLFFGLTGSTKMVAMRDAIAHGAAGGGNTLTMLVATALVLAGFGFKTAAVPFHFWCPDVYAGAPTPVTAFLSVAPKAAGFAALIRFFFTGLSNTAPLVSHWSAFSSVNWTLLVIAVSVATMTLGNLAALRQNNMKRLLAYSSIAHAGYILMGTVVLTAEGLQAVLVYLVTYLFMNLGAFIIVIEMYNRTGSFELGDYRGLYRRSPFLTITMSVFLLSLMGIPPFAGFFGKLYVFGAAVQSGLAWYAVVGALNSVIAVYYYARIIKTMVIEEGEGDLRAIRVSWANQALLWVMLVPTAGLMLVWDSVQRLTGSSVSFFLGS
jgi:NADH-quinone oxidoreductase subunit N